MSTIKLYDGMSTSLDDFLEQFQLLAALNTWDDKTQSIIVKAYLSGAALTCYQCNYVASNSFEDVQNFLKKEFATNVDYASIFYKSKQSYNEPVLEYIYKLELLAKKAKITSPEVIIRQILTTMTYNNKKYFGANIYNSLDELKSLARQAHDLFNSADTQLSLPVKISTIGAQNPCSQSFARGDCQDGSRSEPSANFRRLSDQNEGFFTPQSARVRFGSPPPPQSGPSDTTYVPNRGATFSRSPLSRTAGRHVGRDARTVREPLLSSGHPDVMPRHNYGLRSRDVSATRGGRDLSASRYPNAPRR